MGLRAYSIHRPFLPIGQAHILFAVRQLSGQKLTEKATVTGIIFRTNDSSQHGTAGKNSCEVVSLLHLAQVVFCFPEVEIPIQGHSTQFLK